MNSNATRKRAREGRGKEIGTSTDCNYNSQWPALLGQTSDFSCGNASR